MGDENKKIITIIKLHQESNMEGISQAEIIKKCKDNVILSKNTIIKRLKSLCKGQVIKREPYGAKLYTTCDFESDVDLENLLKTTFKAMYKFFRALENNIPKNSYVFNEWVHYVLNYYLEQMQENIARCKRDHDVNKHDKTHEIFEKYRNARTVVRDNFDKSKHYQKLIKLLEEIHKKLTELNSNMLKTMEQRNSIKKRKNRDGLEMKGGYYDEMYRRSNMDLDNFHNMILEKKSDKHFDENIERLYDKYVKKSTIIDDICKQLERRDEFMRFRSGIDDYIYEIIDIKDVGFSLNPKIEYALYHAKDADVINYLIKCQKDIPKKIQELEEILIKIVNDLELDKSLDDVIAFIKDSHDCLENLKNDFKSMEQDIIEINSKQEKKSK